MTYHLKPARCQRAIAAVGFLILGLAGLTVSGAASAGSYFVQPIVGIGGGGTINGLEINGATQRSESFTLDFQSSVDLNDGTIKGIVDSQGPFQTAFSQGRLGENVIFNGGAGTTVDFSFSFDGSVDAEVIGLNPFTNSQIIVDGYFAVFDSLVGANSSNWFDLGILGDQALISDRTIFDWSKTTVDVSEQIDEVLGGSVVLGNGTNSFDVFANLTLIGGTSDTLGFVTLDFLATGTFGIETEPGVTYTSESGVFLEATGLNVSPVPVPAALPLFGSGLALIGLLGWRRKRQSAGPA